MNEQNKYILIVKYPDGELEAWTSATKLSNAHGINVNRIYSALQKQGHFFEVAGMRINKLNQNKKASRDNKDKEIALLLSVAYAISFGNTEGIKIMSHSITTHKMQESTRDLIIELIDHSLTNGVSVGKLQVGLSDESRVELEVLSASLKAKKAAEA